MRAAVAVPGMPRDEDGPVFREPWEAHAFAMALALHEARCLHLEGMGGDAGAQIKRAQAAGDPDTGETYYRHWLATLETLVAAKGVATSRRPASLPRRLGPRRRPHAAWRSRSNSCREISAKHDPEPDGPCFTTAMAPRADLAERAVKVDFGPEAEIEPTR